MYKQASKLSLRFLTHRGQLSVEQLWDLSQAELTNLIKNVKTILKRDSEDDELSFLAESNTVDTVNTLRFNILKDIYLTKKEALESARTAADSKAFEQKILNLIADKQDEEFKGKSIEELKALLDKN